jgi:hypothetical protein
MIKVLKTVATVLLTHALLVVPSLAGPKSDAVLAAGSEAEWLIIQTAAGAQFDGTKLTLTTFDPSVVVFSDRPVRVATAISTDELLKL